MKAPKIPLPLPIELEAGERFVNPDPRLAWRVERGLLGLDTGDDVEPSYGIVAIPGDLVGLDAPTEAAAPLRVDAITWVRLHPIVTGNPAQARRLLTEALHQARRQSRDLIRLRTGSMPDRVRFLLTMLRQASDYDNDEVDRPPLKTLAGLVDSRPETICRVFSRMRDLQVLQPRNLRRTRVDMHQLHAFKVPAGMTSSVV